MTIQITNSELFAWQRCRRMWLLHHYLGYALEAAQVVGNQILGIRIHAALEGYYGYDLDPLTVLGVLYQLALDEFPEYESDLLAERDLATAMIEGYIEWIAAEGKDATLTSVATEAEVIVPLPGVPGVELRAKLDAVVYDSRSELLSFLDHKTAASFDRHEIMELDPQFRFYSLVQRIASQDNGMRVLGGYVNTLRRVKRTDRSRPPYFQRDPFRFNEQMIDATLLKVQGLARHILATREWLDWLYTQGQSDLTLLNQFQQAELPPTPILTDCSWRCPFTALCPMMDDGSDWAGALTRSGHYKAEDPQSYYGRDPLKLVRQTMGIG